MRKISKWVVAAAALMTIGVQHGAQAAFVGSPMALKGAIQAIRFESPTLPPMAFTMFCLKYADECKPQRMVFRGGRLKLTDERWADLRTVNRSVNEQIRPEPNLEG